MASRPRGRGHATGEENSHHLHQKENQPGLAPGWFFFCVLVGVEANFCEDGTEQKWRVPEETECLDLALGRGRKTPTISTIRLVPSLGRHSLMASHSPRNDVRSFGY